MSDRKSFQDFFAQFEVNVTIVNPEEVVIEMDNDLEWDSALSVGQVWFLFGKDGAYLGLLNDETMEFEAR